MAKKAAAKKNAVKSPKSALNFDELQSVLELMEKHHLAEFEWEGAGIRLALRHRDAFPARSYASHSPALLAPQPPSQLAAPQPAPASSAVSKPQAPSNHKQVNSPFVGTFYRSSAPGKEAYVKEGQAIKAGDVLCIVEAMKLMNEIEAEFGGKIVSIIAENGQPVEFGEPLFVVEAG